MRGKADFRPWTAFLVVLLAGAGYLSLRPQLLVFETPELAIFATLVLVATLLIAGWSDRRTARRLRRLAREAGAMMNGDYSATCDESGGDALASVSRSFNQLARQIGASLDKLKRSEERVRELAYRDTLTGLPNRRMFEDLLEREVEAAGRCHYGLALAILDLDNLKAINDSLGHASGDGLLVGVAKRLAKRLRGSDVLARLGGDEFALIMRTRGRREHVVPAMNRLVKLAREPFDVGSREVMTSLSIGLCFFPEDGDSPRELMSNADFALYQAKKEGRNRIRQFDQSLSDLSTERSRIEQDLRRAMEGDEFTLWYQPIVSLKDQRLVGVESLVRWQHPEHELIMPAGFISLAEESGLMPQLGYRVLVKACRRAVLWQEKGYAPIQVSVNVSVRQLQTGDFVDSVERVLTLTGLDPQYLKLEISESIAAAGQRVLDHLTHLRSQGVHLAIDDFGTGYSSFSYLLEHRIDTLKIDRSFVGGVPDNPDSTAIVKAILSLAQSLDLEVVAEGIETREQLDYLLDGGCRLGQGYLFQRPAPAEDIEPLVRAGRVGSALPDLAHPMAAPGHLLSRSIDT